MLSLRSRSQRRTRIGARSSSPTNLTSTDTIVQYLVADAAAKFVSILLPSAYPLTPYKVDIIMPAKNVMALVPEWRAYLKQQSPMTFMKSSPLIFSTANFVRIWYDDATCSVSWPITRALELRSYNFPILRTVQKYRQAWPPASEKAGGSSKWNPTLVARFYSGIVARWSGRLAMVGHDLFMKLQLLPPRNVSLAKRTSN